MIISLPFWVFSVSIAVIKIIFSGTVGAIFAFYARHSHDNYANSIRWSRIGGFFEMVTLFRNSHGEAPTQSRVAMILLILASLFTLFVSILLGGLVSPANKGVQPGHHESSTEQLMSSDPLFFWTAFMEADSTMEGTLISTLNDTRLNPNPIEKTRYTPRTYDYETACDESAAYFGMENIGGLSHPPPPLKCKLTVAMITNTNYIWDPTTAFVHFISSSIALVAAPISYSNNSNYVVPQPIFKGVERRDCVRASRPNRGGILPSFPNDGIINLPTTDATKCQYGSDESIAMAITSIEFAVNRLDDFDKVVASIFEDASDIVLLQSMGAAIKNGIFLNPNNIPSMAMIAKMTSDVDYLICISRLLQGRSMMSLICTYIATALISVKPQSWDPIMREGLKRGPIQFPDDLNNPISQIDLSVFHLPRATTTKSTFSFSTTHLLKATTDAADYLASLGHNVFINTTGRSESEGLYILYDTVKLEDAFEVPTVSLFVVFAVVLICAVAWVISEVFHQPVYNGSLYKVIFREIEAKDEKTPMLMDCANDPLAFEGDQVVPLNAVEQPESTSSFQDTPILPIDKVPSHQAPTPETATRSSSQSVTPTTSAALPPRSLLRLQGSGTAIRSITPRRTLGEGCNPTPPTTTQASPLSPPSTSQTTNLLRQASPPLSPPPNEKPTLIQTPF